VRGDSLGTSRLRAGPRLTPCLQPRKARTVSRVCRRSLCGVRLPVGWPRRSFPLPGPLRSSRPGFTLLSHLRAGLACYLVVATPTGAGARGLLRRALLVGEPLRREDRRAVFLRATLEIAHNLHAYVHQRFGRFAREPNVRRWAVSFFSAARRRAGVR